MMKKITDDSELAASDSAEKAFAAFKASSAKEKDAEARVKADILTGKKDVKKAFENMIVAQQSLKRMELQRRISATGTANSANDPGAPGMPCLAPDEVHTAWLKEIYSKTENQNDLSKEKNPEDSVSAGCKGFLCMMKNLIKHGVSSIKAVVSKKILGNKHSNGSDSANLKTKEDFAAKEKEGNREVFLQSSEDMHNIPTDSMYKERGVCWEQQVCEHFGGKTVPGLCFGGGDNVCCQTFSMKPSVAATKEAARMAAEQDFRKDEEGKTPSADGSSTVNIVVGDGPPPKPGADEPGQPLQVCKDGVQGMCWEPYMCVKYGGSTESGHCSGGNDNACCVAYQESPLPDQGGEIPKPIFFGSKTGPREAALLAAIGSVGIKGIEACQFMAQMAHESDQFKAMEEYASGSAYEGRSDLGNTQPGDGKRYKGRGYIQLTGRANYITFGKKLGLDLVGHPEQASDPPIAAKVAISYWMKRVRPRVTDFTDTRRVTRLINGGTNGLSDRISKFSKYKAAGMQPVAEAGKLDPSNSGKHDPVDTEPAEEQGGRGNSKGMSTESKENSMDQIGVNEGTPGDCTGAKAWADALKHPEIHFNSFHPSGVKDNANAKAEAVAASKGRRAERSAYEGAPGGVTCLEKGMAQFLIALADEIGGVTVNEIAGGSHSFKSSHYAGHAVDIGKVEGKRMDSSNPHLKKTVELCKRFGANWACTADKSFTKCSSHKTWTHCQWNKWKGELSVDEMRKAKGWPK
jgi:predicted chitinase